MLDTVAAPTLWDLELANAIAAVSQHPPRNGFEEMLQWTKEGKLWTFPVNNEAGMSVVMLRLDCISQYWLAMDLPLVGFEAYLATLTV